MTLALDVLAARCMTALEAAGVAGVLLKGPTVAGWLYDPGEVRAYGDVDILVGHRRVADARAVLREADPGGAVDLHEAIGGVGLHPARAFPLLCRHSVATELCGMRVRALDETARMVHVALHAGWHGPSAQQPLADLERAVERLGDDAWRRAVELAGELAALPSFVTGLDLVESGRALRRRLGLPDVVTTRARIGFGDASPPAQRLADIELAHGWIAKGRAVRRALVPSDADMTLRYPDAETGRRHLRWAHPARLRRLGELPEALATWRRARRDEP